MAILTIEKIIAHYEAGRLTRAESLFHVVAGLDRENIGESLRQLPLDWRKEIENKFCPPLNHENQETCFVQGGSWTSAENYQIKCDELAENFQKGIEALRWYLDTNSR